MTTQTTALTDFLLARLAEDEAAAREAQALAETPWRATYGRQVETAREGYLVTPEDEHSYSSDPTDAVSQHIARHDPARVLAEVEAKRRIVALHHPLILGEESDYPYESAGHLMYPECAECGSREQACPTLRALALPFADHPEFDEAWRP